MIKIIWYNHIKAIDEKILNTEIGKDGRLKQLSKTKEKLQKAFRRVK
jgi:hypothetical protein